MKHRLNDTFAGVWELPSCAESGIACVRVDAEMAKRFNKIQGKLTCYSFALTLKGNTTLLYNGHEINIHPGTLYHYTPGSYVSVVSSSDDYQSICVLAEEELTHESPFLRKAIRAVYFPYIALQEPTIELSDSDMQGLCRRMLDISASQDSDNPLNEEIKQLLYAVFLLELINVQERTMRLRQLSERPEELFLEFIRLVPQHFLEHRDIAFYADRLSITPVYLSRIVRQVTGRTVVEYINRTLLVEASWRLQSTRQTLTQIAEDLHFSNRSSFIRFFTRMRGISPKQYRMEK